MNYFNLTIPLIIGLISITVIDTVGAVVSRTMKFNYAYLSILTFVVYTSIGYYVSTHYQLSIALLINAIMGLYDGSIGFWLSIILKSNSGLTIEQSYEMLGVKSALAMIIASIAFGLIGFGLSIL